jgi:hypothetical protein
VSTIATIAMAWSGVGAYDASLSESQMVNSLRVRAARETNELQLTESAIVVLCLPGAMVLHPHHHQVLDWLCTDPHCQWKEVD